MDAMPKLEYQQSVSFFRDKFVPFSEANVSIGSSPVLYGLSVYTVFSVNWNHEQHKLYVFRLKEHYDRLLNSANIMDFNTFKEEWDWPRFRETMEELIRRNHIEEDALVRVTVFIDELLAGTRIHDLKNSLSAYVYPMGEILPRSGVHLCISSWQRNVDNAIPAKAKINGSYVNAALMKNEALLNGYDDAISLDHNGHVAESTVANLFVVRGESIATPDTSTDILEGITRDTVIEMALKAGMKVEQRSIDRTELYKVDEAFLCGSSARITPILSIDKRPIGSGSIGPATRRFMQDYDDLQRGTSPDFSEWRSTV